MMTMKEACSYLKEKRHKAVDDHKLKVFKELGEMGTIVGFTHREERRSIKDSMKYRKKAGNKGNKAAYNRIWRLYDLPKI